MTSSFLTEVRQGLLDLQIGPLTAEASMCLEACTPLALSSSLFSENASGISIYQSSGSGSFTPRDRLKTILACVVFVAKTLPRSPAAGHLSLGKLLHALELPYATFIVAIRDFLSAAEPALVRLYRQEGYAVVQAAARDVIERFSVSYGIRHHLSKKLEPCLGAGLALSHPLVSATWLMFIVTKARNPAIEQEGMPALAELLACCVNKLIAHAPQGILRADPTLPSSTAAKELFKVRGARNEIDTLTSVCDAFKVPRASADRVRRLMALVDAAVADVAAKKADLATCAVGPHPCAAFIDVGCQHHAGLMEGPHLGALLEGLRAEYALQMAARGEVDERIFETDAFVAQTAGGAGTAAQATQQNPMIGDLRTLTPLAHRVAAPPPVPGSAPMQALTLGAAQAHPTPPYSTFARTGSLPAPSPLRPGPFGVGAVQSPLLNRMSGLPPTTPVTASLNATLWLRQLANDLPDAALEAPPCFRNLAPGPAALMRATVTRHIATALPEPQRNGSGFQSVQPESVHLQRRQEAARLCFLVLDRMTGGDGGALTQLASSDRSLRSFVALVCEAVLWCHQPVGFLFPATLERLDLTPFDIFRFIRPFHQFGQVPAELDRYLIKIMMSLVEERAWERGSQLFIFLCKACEHATPAGVAALAPAPLFTQEAAAPPAAPRPRENTEVSEALPSATGKDSGENSQVTGGSGQHPAGPSAANHSRIAWLPDAFEEDRDSPEGTAPPASASQDHPGASEGSHRSRPAQAPPDNFARSVVREFFHQVVKLSRERIGSLCDRMELESREQRQLLKALSLEVMEKALFRRTRLFYNRHVDQIMLCAVYGVCKVLQMKDQKFKDIVLRYQKQPQASQTVFRQVITKQTVPGLEVEQRNDIIVFYNQVFMPDMKRYLLECNRSPKMVQYQQMMAAQAAAEGALAPADGGPGSLATGTQLTATAAAAVASLPGPSGSPLARHVAFAQTTTPLRSPRAAPTILVSPLKVGAAGLVAANPNNLVVVLGEPLHAFTSPSKEIQSINDRLKEGAQAGAAGEERDAKRRKKQP